MMMSLALEIEIGGEKIDTRVRSEREGGRDQLFIRDYWSGELL